MFRDLFMKYIMYEAASHVPLLVSLPGIRTGLRRQLVEHIDLFPTICDLAGAPIPTQVQGRSLTPLLRGDIAPPNWRDVAFSQIGHIKMIRHDRWKLIVHVDAPEELYDLNSDPHEFHNRIADPACADVVCTLVARLRDWYHSHPPHNLAALARPSARIHLKGTPEPWLQLQP